MNSSLNIFPVFSKNLCVGNLGLSEKEITNILNIIKNEKLKTTDENDIDKKDQASASVNCYIFENENLLFLKNKITNYVNQFLQKILLFSNNNFEITTSWVAKSSPGKMCHWHNHNNCFYSGVYYVNAAKDCGDISLSTFEPKRYLLNVEKENQYNASIINVNVQKDRIILFPAEIYHKINRNNSNIDRYSIAFNIMPTGKIGLNDSCLIYNI